MAMLPRPARLPLCLALAGLAALATPALAQKIGVNSAVNPDASGTPPGAATRQLILGQEIVHNEHVVTGPAGQTQILFLDESAMTVGPNSDLSIDNFVYDPNTGKGQLAMNATAGVLRFVGGKLSKNEDSVTLKTPAATIGIRGGVFLLNLAKGGKLDVVFLYGKGLSVTGANVTQLITRPGFSVSVAGPGQPPSSPAAAPPNQVAATLASFNGKRGSSGGSSNPPSDASVANSGISNDISGNVAASVQQAGQSAGNTAPPAVNVGTIQATTQQNTVGVQGDSAVSSAQQNPTPPGTPIAGTGGISGIVKIIPAGSRLGFTDQSSSGRIPYVGSLNSGVATGTSGAGQLFSLSPLVAGQTTNVTATATGASIPASGTAFLASDSAFFYGNLTGGGTSGDQIFVFGGVPVSPSYFLPGGNPTLQAFTLQPDPSLGAQTIPFLAAGAGGTLANAVVSPFYVINRPGTAFGGFNAGTNPNGTGTFSLQASLAINGTGASQQSALNIATGGFFTSSDNGKVVGDALMRGMFLPGGTAGPVRSGSNAATVPDAFGNALFGTTSIDGFVLDSNAYSQNNNFVTATDNFSANGTTTNYAFNQVATASAVPAGVGVARSALSEAGFFGGLMVSGTTRYALNGVTGVASNPTTNTVALDLVGGDFLTPSSSGVSSISMNFGTSSGRNFSRSTFIDNNTYGAVDSATVPWTFNSTTLPIPTLGGPPAPTGAIVTSGTVPGAANGLFAAAGATPCNCQFLQWGYWSANIPQTDSNGNVTRNDRSFINTWLAGQPTVTLPASGTASYNGAAIGTVTNAGNAYLAAGQYRGVFNFGANSGSVAISNFDGRNLSGTVGISQSSGVNVFSGNISGTNLAGQTLGGFFGPGAQETGGTFAFKNTTGPTYIASGIYAGR
jgi:trimeric autotransporter adhesin